MAKVLIASLGDAKKKSGAYYYENANYYLADKSYSDIYETPFVATAIKEFYNIDKIIFIGTVGSSWFLLYCYLYSKKNTYFIAEGIFEKDYFDDLELEYCKSKEDDAIKLKTQVDSMQNKLDKLKSSMGSICRDIVVLEYGITPEEQLKNLEILNRLADSLQDGDEVYFDISHAFRSLPFYELLAINLAKSIMQKNIRIEMVTYGMYEINEQNGNKTPIVDMTQLIELLDWTRAVDEYNRKGSFDLLLDLMSNKSYIVENFNELMSNKVKQSFMNLIKTMSLTHNYGDLATMIKMSSNALINLNKTLNHPTLMIMYQITKQIIDFFERYKEDRVALIYAFVQWKINKGQIVLGTLLLMDAIECTFLDILGVLYSNKENDKKIYKAKRKEVHEKLVYISRADPYVKSYIERYKELRDVRNDLAHPEPIGKKDFLGYMICEAKFFKETYLENLAPGKPKRKVFYDLLR